MSFSIPFFGHDVLFSFDSSGIFIYAKKFGGYYTERPLKILVDEFDNFYIAGHFTDSILTDPNISMQGINSVGNQDAFIAYFGPERKNQFILPLESMGTDYYINNLLLDKNYHLIISGGYEGYTDFDLGINVAQDFSSGYSDFYASRYRIERIPQTGFDYHKYSGTIYRDYNLNGIQDPGDPALKTRLVIRTPGSNYGISDQTGYYAGYGVKLTIYWLH
ncbi:MAG: hypothetical protein IPP71_19655 [Bacteroidetes bacterium]|nr:hypothetical protein [Bacteroidota bacterium]